MADLKGIKKGDMVTLHMFTGAIVDGFKVEKADAKTLGFTNKKGVHMVFDKKSGKQIDPEPKAERFANYVTEYDEDEVQEALDKRANKTTKKAAEKPAEKPSKKKVAKPSKKKVAAEDEDDVEELD